MLLPARDLLLVQQESLTKVQFKFLMHVLTAVKRTTATWLNDLLSVSDLKSRVHNTLANEKLSAKILNNKAIFTKNMHRWTVNLLTSIDNF